MLLRLTKRPKGYKYVTCELTVINTVTGNTDMGLVRMEPQDVPAELFYPVSVHGDALFMRRQRVEWQWSSVTQRNQLIELLHYVQEIREPIYMEVTHHQPDPPGYPYNDYNRYAWHDEQQSCLMYDQRSFDEWQSHLMCN